jgi:two-component system sensor histidine kinase AtoS
MTELRPRLRPLAEEIAVEIEEDLPDVHVDERHIAQVLVILLQNALDAAGSPSRVRVRLRLARALHPGLRSTEGDPSVTFEVINEGAGIAPDVLGRVFDPFFTTKPTGTGLGLSIAQQLVHENCGRLGVDSPPGGPTSFWLVVPT